MTDKEVAAEVRDLSDFALSGLLLDALNQTNGFEPRYVAMLLKEAAGRWFAAQCGGLRLRFFNYQRGEPF
jgi:hypothetical protein